MTEENKNPTPAPVEEVTKQEAKAPSDEKWLSAIAYIPGLFVMPLMFKPKSKSCQFHAKQGLGMSALLIAVLFVLAIIPMLGSILFLCFFALSIVGLMKALDGTLWKIPVLGEVMDKVDLSKAFAVTPASKEAPTEEPKEEAMETPAETPVEPAQETPAIPAETTPVTEEKTPAEPVAPTTPVESPAQEEKPAK